jgi:hypothetical protein
MLLGKGRTRDTQQGASPGLDKKDDVDRPTDLKVSSYKKDLED